MWNRYLICGLLTITWLCSSCLSLRPAYNPNQKFSPDQLQKDFDIAWNTYKKNHPAFDWYLSADSINRVFQRVRMSLTDSLSEPEFRLRLSYAVAHISCGHTSVLPSKAFTSYAGKARLPRFPLGVKIWGQDSMVVIENLSKDTQGIKKGIPILSIDSIPSSVFIRQMKEYIAADGFNEVYKELQAGANFSARFRWMYGLKESYQIGYLDEKGIAATAVLQVWKPAKKDSLSKREMASKLSKGAKPHKPTYGSFRIDTAKNLALLELNNFSHARIPSLIRKSFRTIYREKIPHLVLDLRLNGGGKIVNSTLLTKYLVNRPFRVADSVSAKDLRPAYPDFTQSGWFFRYFGWAITRKEADGRYHMHQPERKVHKPKKKNHFDGDVYILTGGYTFSASTLMLAKIMDQPNVTIIGEETGGAARGNSAVFTPFVTLPNTKVRARLPLFKMISDDTIPDNGRGIMPDFEVKPDSESIRLGKDKKLEKVYELLASKKK